MKKPKQSIYERTHP